MFFFSLVPYVDPNYMNRKWQIVMFLKRLHTLLHKREYTRCSNIQGKKNPTRAVFSLLLFIKIHFNYSSF